MAKTTNQFRLYVNLGNDALLVDEDGTEMFDPEGDNASTEVARILRELADKVETQGLPDALNYQLVDVNGNTVGSAYRS